jgi:hypothetical protein
MARNQAQRNHYAELAFFLNPESPLEGARQIDVAILDGLRLRENRRTFWRLSERLGMWCCVVSIFLAVMPFEVAWVGVKHWPIPGIAWQYGVIGVVAGIIMIMLSFRHMFEEGPPYEAPPVIADWLRDQGEGRSLKYWDEIYWSWPKREAYRYRFLGFTVWRKAPLDVATGVPGKMREGTA